MSTLPRKCAPSAIATRGEMMSPSTDPLSRMSTLSLAVTLPVTSPRTIDRLREHLRLDLPVRADRQHVLAELNRAFDMTFDGQVFAAVQLAFDDDRFADVHDVLLHMMARLCTRPAGPAVLAARAAAAQPSVVRSRVGPLHRVSTCIPPPVLFRRALGHLPWCAGTRKSAASIWNAPEACLVLLFPRVSGNDTMNDSPCVSILTTTPRPLLRPRSSTRSSRATRDQFGNASSVHHFGQQAKAVARRRAHRRGGAR